MVILIINAAACLVDDTNDRRASLHGLDALFAARLIQQHLIAAAVVKVEAAVHLLCSRKRVAKGVLRAAKVGHFVRELLAYPSGGKICWGEVARWDCKKT